MRESKLDITLENRNTSNIFVFEFFFLILIHEIITQNLNYKLIL